MTRHQTLQCVHEPFGDAYYFGPERLAERYESDSQAREESGYSESTYRTIFDRIAKENSEVCMLAFGVNLSISILPVCLRFCPDRRYWPITTLSPTPFICHARFPVVILRLTNICGCVAQAGTFFFPRCKSGVKHANICQLCINSQKEEPASDMLP
jgi:hypothetical protein